MTTQEQNRQIINYLQPYKPSKIGVFGSVARGQNTPNSDLDLLINLESPIDLFKFMEIWDYLEDLLKIKIDLVTDKALSSSNKRVQKSISNDLILIYEK
jgi:predicted nucleotidyltransferase